MQIKKDNLYFLTLLSLIIIVMSVSYLTIDNLFEVSKENLLANQLESSKRESKEIARLLETQIQNGLRDEIVIRNLQSSIENTELHKGFICMYDTFGIELCHPDTNRIGQRVDETTVVQSLAGEREQKFRDLITSGKTGGGVRLLGEDAVASEIIYVHPVPSRPWMVAAHANTAVLKSQLKSLKNRFLVLQLAGGLIVVLLSFFTTRWFSSRYENQIEIEKENLTKEMVSMASLNAELTRQRQQLSVLDFGQELKERQRIVTYWRDQIIPVSVDTISFFYTDGTSISIYCTDNKVFQSNTSLDDIHAQLNKKVFFRANRQYIVSMRAIDKIFRYGNSQVKLETVPPAPEEIIISKNRVAEFKEWLNS